MSAVQKRRELRQQARERHQTVLPRLKAAVQAARARKKRRLAECRTHCDRHRKRVQADARKARQELRAALARAKEAARAACTACRVTAKADGLEEIDRALAKVGEEREAIAELRRRAARLKSSRGAAGGRRAAELRAESDDEVRRDLDDPLLQAVWKRVRSKIKGSPHMSRTEAFLEHVHRHPELLDEERARQEHQWEREAEQLYAEMQPRRARGRTDAELDKWMRELDDADRLLATPAAAGGVPF